METHLRIEIDTKNLAWRDCGSHGRRESSFALISIFSFVY